VIYIDSKVANYTFTEDQLRLMTAVGAQTGLALENAELYRKGLASARLAAIGETVASLSHSIRNMMQAIRGGSEVVELGLRKNDISVVRNGWDISSRNLDRVFQLTMNMLAFSKQRKPDVDLISLPKLLREIVELIEPQCEKRNIALVAEVDREMPPVPADANGLHQAIMNLMTNAIEAVEPETGVVTLRCDYNPTTHAASIIIADNGHGIDPQSRNQLFKPFYSTKGLRGTGLGLVVTKKIIEEHGGSIKIESEPKKGTTVTLTFSGESVGDPAATH
jgi:two-component system NtrC family sensor kinase